MQTVSTIRSAVIRVLRPGRVRARLAYGPGFRRVTNVVALRVARPGRQRVVAGWGPLSITADGRDLWVVSSTRRDTSELRLLDARTGRLRRGPVTVAPPGTSAALVETGGRVLLQLGASEYRMLDHARPGLLGPPATPASGACAATCTPATVTGAGPPELPSRTSFAVAAPVSGPDGRIWGLARDPATLEEEAPGALLLEAAEGAAPVVRGAVGPMSAHGGFVGEVVAVPGGAWVRNAFGAVTWFGAAGPGAPKGTFSVLAGRGPCVWGLAGDGSGTPRLVRLGQGDVTNGPAAGLGKVFLGGDFAQVAVSDRTAWAIVPSAAV